MTTPWKTAWITGGSTGIGRELAIKLAAQGVQLAVSARSSETLEELARTHENILAFPLDVTARMDVAAVYQRIVEAIGPIDLAILNAGVWHPMNAAEYDATRVAQSMSVNYIGIANALEPLIPAMIAAGKGQLALVASVAGYRGLPKAAAYAPSKAAVISLAEVLRLELQRHGIIVSLVNPGFVETPMTAVNAFPMPYIIKPEDAANRILRGLARGKYEIAFPWQLVTMLKLLRLMPNSLYLRVAGRL
jgi:short-subunit dehydrogenase